MRMLLMLLVALAPAAALADTGTAERNSVFELKVSSFQPNVDAQFSTSPGPYEAVFGNKSELLFQLGYELHLVRTAGSLSLGFTGGYWSVQGKALADFALGDGGAVSSNAGSDNTTLQVFPLTAQLSYRFDLFADRFPIAPVLRAGLDYYLWRVLDGTDEVTNFEPGKEASGGTYGFHVAAGLHILLDFFAQGMAANFQSNAGVYNTFLTVEYQLSQVDDFGSNTSIRLGDETFVFGLALEF